LLSHPILWESGVFLPEQRLWLDPKRPRPRAVISHAHSDHVAAHPLAYATPATRRLVSSRRPSTGGIEAIPFGETVALDSCQITFHPAGHVLGLLAVRPSPPPTSTSKPSSVPSAPG